MKLNLGSGLDVRTGYINCDRVASPGVTVADFKNLSNVVPDSSCDEILAIEIMQYIDATESQAVLSQWITKLQKDGELYIQSLDSTMMGNVMQYEQATVNEINKLLFGENGKDRSIAVYNLTGMDTLLKSLGMQVINKSYIGNTHFAIRAKKI